MTIFESIFLGIVQGLTEFLPVSSSGHLALFQYFFHITTPTIFFDTVLHLGTLIAVIFYLRKDIWKILTTLNERKTLRLVSLLVLATIPAVIAGVFLQNKMEQIFKSLGFVGLFFIITSIILSLTYFVKRATKNLDNLSWFDSLFIGIFQAIAILPGVSRSGSTISASLYRNLKREDAFRFSFLLSIPVILGAFLLQLKKQHFHLFNGDFTLNLIGFLFAAVFGLLSLKIIERVLIKGKFYYFAVYCLVLGVLILIFIH